MGIIHGGQVIAKILEEWVVKYVFTIQGMHIWPIMDALHERGIKIIHMRHEQSSSFAADGWARVTGQPGVFLVTAGPGMVNSMPGIFAAWAARSPIIGLAGQHSTSEDHKGALSEAYGVEACHQATKWSKRVTDWSTIAFNMKKAIKEALASPPGPVFLEFPIDILYLRDEEAKQKILPPDFYLITAGAWGDPDLVKKAVALLLSAERPLIVASDGIFWSKASEELREFAELLKIPVYTRRMGLGAISEDHPLSIRGVFKKKFTAKADVILVIGFRFWAGEDFGRPPTWNPQARFIQVDANPAEIGVHIPVTLGILGDPKAVLKQMIACAKEIMEKPKERSDWVESLRRAREFFEKELMEEEKRVHDAIPIHPMRLCKEIVDFLDKDATIIYDSFTGSGYLTKWVKAAFIGQVLDGGPMAPVGHGVGMAIGAQLARPGKQVFVMLGDGGLGISAMDIETALRYKLPIVFLISNNSSWGGSPLQRVIFGEMGIWDMLPNIRYDKMFEVIGCHGEHVEDPSEIRTALDRAFNSGITSVINVFVDRNVSHPMFSSAPMESLLRWRERK